MSSISKLPHVSSAPPALESGVVRLYKDADWSSEKYTIKTHDYASGKRHSISGTSLQDKATWVAFNLPVGTVMTLAKHVSSSSSPVYDLAGLGPVVDLVGTGQTESVDLGKVGMSDKISSFFWRKVDLSLGALELYEHDDYEGNRTVIFLSDWSQGEIHSLDGWCMQDRSSSAKWETVQDIQMVTLFEHADGGGSRYDNITGWGGTRHLKSFEAAGFNDKLSSFSWGCILPRKEEVEPVTVDLSPYAKNGTNLYAHASGTNDSSMVTKQTITLRESKAQTTTVTVTNTYTPGIELSASYSVKGKFRGQEMTMTLGMKLSFTYSHSNTRTTSYTETTDVSVSQEFDIPPYSSCEAELIVHMGELPSIPCTTTAKRWYEEQVPGSTLDPTNGWYMRTETVKLELEGSLACGTQLTIKETKLPGH